MKRVKILPGQRFGRWTVLNKVDEHYQKGTKAFFRCKCDCGNEKIVDSSTLLSGRSKSCGCLRRDLYIDRSIIGKKFGMLTILEIDRIYHGRKFVKCKCDCGNVKVINYGHIQDGSAKSCGCLTESFGERKCSEILKKFKITFSREFTFKDLKSPDTDAYLRFDVAVKSRNGLKIKFLIEYDGEQHYFDRPFFKQSFKQVQEHDRIKNQYCKDHNIPLLRISYREYNHIEGIIINFIKENFPDIYKKNIVAHKLS